MKGGRAKYDIEICFYLLQKNEEKDTPERPILVKSIDYDISLFLDKNIAFKYKLYGLLAPGIRNKTQIEYVELRSYKSTDNDISVDEMTEEEMMRAAATMSMEEELSVDYTYLLEYGSYYAGNYIYKC